MSAHWVYLKAGTEIVCYQNAKTGPNISVISESDSKLRWRVRHVRDGWNMVYNGLGYYITNFKSHGREIKFPSMTREFANTAKTGTKWRFTRDWIFNGYCPSIPGDASSSTVHIIPAGTEITIIKDKMTMMWYGENDKCLVCEYTPELHMFKTLDYNDILRPTIALVPAREASSYLELVNESI